MKKYAAVMSAFRIENHGMTSTAMLASNGLGEERNLIMCIWYRANLTNSLQKWRWGLVGWRGENNRASKKNAMVQKCARGETRTPGLSLMRRLHLPLSYPGMLVDIVFYSINNLKTALSGGLIVLRGKESNLVCEIMHLFLLLLRVSDYIFPL